MYFGSEFEAPAGRGLWESEEDIRQTAGVPARSLAHRLLPEGPNPESSTSRAAPGGHLFTTWRGGGTDGRGDTRKKSWRKEE